MPRLLSLKIDTLIFSELVRKMDEYKLFSKRQADRRIERGSDVGKKDVFARLMEAREEKKTKHNTPGWSFYFFLPLPDLRFFERFVSTIPSHSEYSESPTSSSAMTGDIAGPASSPPSLATGSSDLRVAGVEAPESVTCPTLSDEMEM